MENGTPAEVIEILKNEGITEEIKIVKCKILNGNEKDKILTRNVIGDIKEGDILMLLNTVREAK